MNPAVDMTSAAISVFVAFLVVMVLLLGALYVARRWMQTQRGLANKGGTPLIRVVASSYLGVKKSISLVRVPGVLLVLSVSGDSVRMLTEITDQKVIDEIDKDLENGNAAGSRFIDHLKKITTGGKVEK